MEKISFILFYLSLFIFSATANAQDILNTSFEDYAVGNIHNQNKWSVSKGSTSVVQDAIYSHTGSNGVKMLNTSAFQSDHIAYTSAQTGLSGDVYVDLWIKINSIATSAFSITGYDLSSSSRSFMVEFSTDGKIKVYNGSSGSSTVKPTYTLGEWNRLSFKINNADGTYRFALNGNIYEDILPFREIKNSATSFYYHSIRFIQSSGSCDIALDDMYISATPMADIEFGENNPQEKKYYNFSLIQPQNATISVSPEPVEGKYQEGTKVTASITVSDLCKYKFNKWTNDISGTSSPITFTVTKDITLGAEIVEIPETGSIRTVKNYEELKTALASMNPGDVIELEDGQYSGNGITVTQSGCAERPIVVKAKNIGQARITGKLYFTLKNISYVTFEGLNFDLDAVSTIFKMEGCSYVRITRNEFRMKTETAEQTSKWILIGDEWDKTICTSHHNRLDHNLFDGKYDGGAWVVIDGAHGTSPGDISKYDRIDHNHFRNNTPRVANEKETVRVGVSDLTPCSAYCTVENNLFENCDGDPEIISVKSCDNLIKGNTLRGCLGTVSLRQGFRNTVEGNYFFGDGKTVDGNGCGGVRVYGKDHKVINNYFEGLTGEKWDAACTITNGDATNSSNSWSAHFVPENIVFAFNTYINNKSDIEIGFTNSGSYGKSPVNNRISNNIFVQNTAPIVQVHTASSLSGVAFSNNIMYPTNTATIGISLSESEVKQIDPQLEKTDCVTPDGNCNYKLPTAVYKLTAGSPAIDAAIGDANLVSADFEGQFRGDARDIGADEYNSDESSIINGVLSSEHVGPYAQDFELTYSTEIENITSIAYFYLKNKTLYVNLGIIDSDENIVTVFDLNGSVVKSMKFTGNTASISLSDCVSGVYLINIGNKEYKISRKIILE
ncbi:MAG: chondroitinase-B domain-containing protein [Dysgonomonas sp.]